MNARERHRTHIRVRFDSEQRDIELLFVDRYVQNLTTRPTGLVYLHRVRQLGLDNDWVQANKKFYGSDVLPKASAELAELVRGRQFDAIFSPPSRRKDALPYRRAILDAIGPAVDWTPLFKRVSGTSAGIAQSCEEVFRSLSFEASRAKVASAGAVLMVDEQVASGSTACAALRVLLAAGLRRDAEFVVAAPLWIERQAK